MLRVILIYGIIGGLIVVVPMLGSMQSTTRGDIPENAALYGYVSMLLAFTMVFVGVKHYRDKVQGGVIRFAPALGVGLGISAVAQANGAPAAEIDRIRSEAAEFLAMYSNPLFRLPITFVEMFPLGVLISLISAALLRNSRFLPARASPKVP